MSAVSLAGLSTIVGEERAAHQDMVILLHGFTMNADDLAPFGQAPKVPALYLLPQAPVAP